MNNKSKYIFLGGIIIGIILVFYFTKASEKLVVEKWRGNVIPWYNCYNCNLCKNKIVRTAGGTLGMSSFPQCGNVCCNDADCPLGCPSCNKGICT